MKEINFKKNVNFWELASFAKAKKFDNKSLLQQAFDKGFLIDKNELLLIKFIDYFQNKQKIYSQLYQDVFASFVIKDNFDKTFLEFGATNGLDLSNTFLLENFLDWNGVLSEPSPQWHGSLRKNRKDSIIITECIWTETGKELEFFESQSGELSTLRNYLDSDIKSMPGNTKLRNEKGRMINVKTISLNDVLKNYFKDNCPSYISVDTEGSEFDILKFLNFEKYRPKLFTIEHNFTEAQSKIDELMHSNNYVRTFKNLTAFDAWYVSEEIYNNLSN